ncbi:hypothetical protein H7X46_24815 [Pseudonocardia sp. C8]|uniref:hypothetical protein n=1 Tax=Pseudonocardia sp. C8 TaxID=2762759 RepID=UPI001642EB51|nr:hypothetical protein [Pseudonocardia sp. C8]MBC3194278.1 hypothetical protein [Pseudonocardia sp. C8]
MSVSGPYERYYAERAAEGKRTVWWPWLFLAAVVPLLVVRAFVVSGEPADATAVLQSAAVATAASHASDGRHRVGPGLLPGVWATEGPPPGGTCGYLRTGPDGAEVSRAAVRGPAAARLVDRETVTFTGGCTWTTR